MSSSSVENRNLRKQIGCMNGFFQIFERNHFISGRRISSCSSKRLLQGGQHQMEQQYATKSVVEKGVEMQKEKPRNSTESSRASFSSSSCSSTFSSLDFNRTIQPETLPLRQISIPESPFQTTSSKEGQPSSTQGIIRSHDLRDVVKDSMHREVRSLSIKPQNNDERRGKAMRHIDSPRPLQQPKPEKPKATGQGGAQCALAKVQEVAKSSRDERLSLPRFSYDGRESREVYKSAMKHKELPRLSLDSKTNSMKAFESRLNQEPGSHNGTSSVVARLMGLDAFPGTISTDESRTPTIKSSCIKEAFLSQISSTPDEHKQNQANYSPRVSQKSPASPSSKSHSANPMRKPTSFSRFPVEPAPWRQQDSSQGSPKLASKNRKAITSTLHRTSVYGEIEKRITELEFKKSGKDLRALKQILEAMQKTRAQMEDQRGEEAAELLTLQRRSSLEENCPHQNSKLPMWKNNKTFHQPTIKEPCSPKQFDSVVVGKPAKVMEKVKLSVPTRVSMAETPRLQNLQTRTPKFHRESSLHRQKANNLTLENRNVKNHSRHLPSTDKRTSWSTSEREIFTTTPRMKLENYTAPRRSSGTVSPRLHPNLLTVEAESGRVPKNGTKKLTEQSRKNRVKAKDQQFSDDQMSEISSETRYWSYQGDTASVVSESNNSLVSQSEAEVTSLARSINTNTQQDKNLVSTTREYMPAAENPATMLEQPSPISVLDSTFYCEDSPSPVKKISTVFQEDESQSPDEAEWCLQNLNHLMDCTRLNQSFKYNQKLENMRNSVQERTWLNKEPDGAAANHNESLNPDYRYINKILLTSGLLKDSSFISTSEKLFSTHHLINPDMFHVLEQTEDIREAVNGVVVQKNDKLSLDKRIQRKMIFDLVDEILVRKITSSRLYTVEKKRASSQGLLKEVHLEMDRLCRISDCNLDEEDEMTRLLSADMMHQSEDWVDYRGEVPALVLDIERQIFKDLINEVITGELMDARDWPKQHCRKLFGM